MNSMRNGKLPPERLARVKSLPQSLRYSEELREHGLSGQFSRFGEWGEKGLTELTSING